MSQRRMIYGKIFASHDLNTLSVQARYLYIGTIVLGDDEGRLNGEARYLRGQIFSYDDSVSVPDVQKWLKELNDIGIIQIYTKGGANFISHPNWHEYQYIRTDRKSESKIPLPPNVSHPVDISRHNISKDKENKDKVIPFENFWNLFPKKIEKKKTEEKWNRIDEPTQIIIMADLAIRVSTTDWLKEKGKYVPKPMTYLNGERWNDSMGDINNSKTDDL